MGDFICSNYYDGVLFFFDKEGKNDIRDNVHGANNASKFRLLHCAIKKRVHCSMATCSNEQDHRGSEKKGIALEKHGRRYRTFGGAGHDVVM